MTTLLQRSDGTQRRESSARLGDWERATGSLLQEVTRHAIRAIVRAFRLVVRSVFAVITLGCGFLIYTAVVLMVPLAPFLGLASLVFAMTLAGLMIANAEIVLLIVGLLLLTVTVRGMEVSRLNLRTGNRVVPDAEAAHTRS
jgi:hypothetical protein